MGLGSDASASLRRGRGGGGGGQGFENSWCLQDDGLTPEAVAALGVISPFWSCRGILAPGAGVYGSAIALVVRSPFLGLLHPDARLWLIHQPSKHLLPGAQAHVSSNCSQPLHH